jgi:signal transduction histidine kinase
MFKTNTSSRFPVTLTALGAVLLVAVVVAAFVIASRTTSLTETVLQTRQIRSASTDELVTLLDAETGQRGFLLTGRAEYLAPYTVARDRAKRVLVNLARLARGATAFPINIGEIQYLADAKLAELQETVDLRRQRRLAEAMDIVFTDRGKALMDRARADLTRVNNDAEAILVANLSALKNYAALQRGVTAVGGILAIVFTSLSITLLLGKIRDANNARVEVENLNATLEERVAERTTALTQANEEIQRFAYIVSHDLRAPLVNVMGFTSELEVGTATLQNYFEAEEPDQKPAALAAVQTDLPEAVKFIRAATGKMDRLINAILKLSREGRRELAPEYVNLQMLFDNLVASLRHQIVETETTVEIGALPAIRSDRLALEQIFGNLFDNALKYLKPGRPGKISVKADSNARQVTVSISDNGRGIAENDLQRVFELFRRAGVQDKRGEGIGLAHTRALVRRLGGDIDLRSQFGVGSEFRVTLPRTLSLDRSKPL